MSIATHPPETRPGPVLYDCTNPECRGVVTPENAIQGHCSHECRLHDQGQRLLNLIKHDHRFCFTCFRQLKRTHDIPEWRRQDLEPVTESAFTGYQTNTQHAQKGERRRYRQGLLPDDTRVGTVCSCGQTDHRDRERVVQDASIKSVTKQLYATLGFLRREGQHDHDLDYLRLVDVLYAQHQHDSDYGFALAVGIAIQEAVES